MTSGDYFDKMPSDVMGLHVLSMAKLPVGASHWRRVVIDNPSWFPDDYDHIVKYSAIPEEVHDAFWVERKQLLQPLEEELPGLRGGMGILHLLQHPDDKQEHDRLWKLHWDARKEQLPQRIAIEKKLHRKYYYEYGIKFNPTLVS